MASRIYEAVRLTDGTGAVLRGNEIDRSAAVTRRKTGLDVVICGDELRSNREFAKDIESAVGTYSRHAPHASSGPDALPHFQQLNPPPEGHAFYETTTRKVRTS
jgi:hypothetical protein